MRQPMPVPVGLPSAAVWETKNSGWYFVSMRKRARSRAVASPPPPARRSLRSTSGAGSQRVGGAGVTMRVDELVRTIVTDAAEVAGELAKRHRAVRNVGDVAGASIPGAAAAVTAGDRIVWHETFGSGITTRASSCAFDATIAAVWSRGGGVVAQAVNARRTRAAAGAVREMPADRGSSRTAARPACAKAPRSGRRSTSAATRACARSLPGRGARA